MLAQHYRLDHDHSNAYTAWQALGSPQQVMPTQHAALQQAGQLALLTAPSWVSPQAGRTVLHVTLPRQGVSLLRLTW